jgi:uncharacterized protein YjbI with pentapeptide repeats
MLGRRSRGFPSHKTEQAGFAAKATDLDALRTAVVDAAGVGTGLWLSYLFVLFYFAIAAGAVTHRDLLLENSVKLPFLNVELPLKAFFILGPLVFPVVHAYVLLHFLLLAGKVGAFHAELREQVFQEEKRAQLRRQLPSNIFVQFLGGPREVREGIVGFLLKSVAGISLVAGPIALLVLFQLQFLPYHNPWISWWQRIAIVLDLILLWLLWPPIARGETAPLTWNDLGRVRVAAWLPVSLLPLLLVFAIATFPGEWLEENMPTVRLVPTSLKAWQLPSVEAVQKAGSGWTTLHELLVAGEVNYITQKPESLWSNVLVLPGFELATDGKNSGSTGRISLRGRRLEGAVFFGADLRRADFSGARLAHADFSFANLRDAKFQCANAFNNQKCAQLQGAVLKSTWLQGAALDGAELQGAVIQDAHLEGASLWQAQLQGALLDLTHLQGANLGAGQLQGASLSAARLQGAFLHGADLQGADLDGANLQGADLAAANMQGAVLADANLQGAKLEYANLRTAFLKDVFVWRTKPPARENLTGAFIERLHSKPIDIGRLCGDKLCVWSNASFADLKASLETVPEGSRAPALERIEPLGRAPFEEDATSAKDWNNLAAESLRSAENYPENLARLLIKIGCDGTPYVIGGLTRRLTIESFENGFGNSLASEAEVARVFLDEANCPEARGLSEKDKAKLQQVGSPKSSQPSPGSASR